MILILSGCSASKIDNVLIDKIYKCVSINNELLDHYYVYTLEDIINGNHKYLLSLKIGSGVDKPPFKEYAEFKKDKIFKLNLIPQDTLYIETENAIRSHRGSYTLYLDDILFLENDTIKAKIYRSEDVFDNFVRLK